MLPIDLLYLIKVNGKAVRLPDDTPVVINNPGYLYMNNLHQGCIVTIEKYQGVEYAIDISGKVIPSADTLALEIAMLTKRIDEIDSLKEKIAASYLDSGIRKSPHEETMEAVREAQALSDDSTIPGHKTMDALIKSLNK